MTSPARRLEALGLTLPDPPVPRGSYAPACRLGDQLWIAGHTDRTPTSGPTTGVIGIDVDTAAGYDAARRAALNLLAAANAAVGLDAVRSALFVRGYVVAAAGFGDHPAVVDGATQLLGEVLGSVAPPARAAIGVATLPGGACVELEAVFALH